LRSAGVNTIYVPPALAEPAWELADWIGLFVIVEGDVELDSLAHPSALARQPR
jgi:hypothetical protein